MSTHRLHIAVVGLGVIGREHVRVIGLCGDLQLVAVVDPAPAAADFCTAQGIRYCRNIGELAELGKLDGVVIASPNNQHVEQALFCIRQGWAVLVEKPIAHELDAAQLLVHEAEMLGAKVLVGHHRTHSSLLQKARALIQSGALGDLVTIVGSATFCKPDTYFEGAAWRTQAGGGPILINLIHEIHSLRLLCGEIEEVQALASSHQRGFQVEDTVCINLRFANGALGTFMLSDAAASARSWEQTSGENPVYAKADDEDCYVVSGRKGSLSVPTMRTKIYPTNSRSWHLPFALDQYSVQGNDPMLAQMEHFGKVMRAEAAPLVSARDGLRNLEVIAAIVQAVRSGKTVQLEQEMALTC